MEEGHRGRKKGTGAGRGPAHVGLQAGSPRGGKGHVQVRAPHRVSRDHSNGLEVSCQSGFFPVLLSELFP